MKVIEDIMKLLKCDATHAESVREQMGLDGLDFSECTQREFNKAARSADNFLRLSSQGTWVMGE